jgi:hypothetical protein
MECDREPCQADLEAMETRKNLPDELRPVYLTETPNQPILLYEGDLEISQHSDQIQGHGKVEYVWFPSPHIKFEFSNQDQNIDNIVLDCVRNYPILLTLSKINVSVNVFIGSSLSGGNDGNFVSGRIKEPIAQGIGKDLTYVLFHVVNFHDFIENQPTKLKTDSGNLNSPNQVVFEVEDWKITLDQLETAKDNIKYLSSQGGFAITHVGKLEKSDGQTFSADEAIEFLDIFANFLSFARGFRVPQILLVGYDMEGNKIWQYWDSSSRSSWKYVDSWFPTNNAKVLAEVFPSFSACWREWQESEKLALYNYLEANAISTMAVQIVLTQMALELIAKKEGQNQGSASDKFRALFNKYKIPVNIPFDRPSKKTSNFDDIFIPQCPPLVESLIKLKNKLQQELKEKIEQETNETKKQKLDKELQQIDAPYIFTKIRNNIVHSKKDIENLSDYLNSASDLGLWYLELVFLAMFDYKGCYTNRLLRYRQNGQTEPVPWSVESNQISHSA